MGRLRARFVSALLAAALICPNPVFAKPPPPAPSAEEARAIDLFKQSEAAYNEGRYRDAIDLLNEAYRLKAKPVILHNLGRAYSGLGDLEKAIESYRRYLKEDPDTTDRAVIEQRISSLERQLEERRQLERQRDAERKRAEEERKNRLEATRKLRAQKPRPVNPWPLITMGVGAAALGTGAVFGLLSKSRHRDAEDEPVGSVATENQRDAKKFATVANVCFVAGGVLVVTGGTLAIIDLNSRSQTRAEISFSGRF